MKIQALILFLIGYNLLYAQTNIKTDSLKNYTYQELQEKFYDYNYDGKSDESKLIAQYYLSKAKQEKNNSQIAEGYAFMYVNENEENALKYIDSMSVVSKKINEDIYPTRIYLLKANIFLKFNNQKEALNNYIIGLKYAKQRNNKRQIALAETNIAYLNNYVGKHLEAALILRYYMDNADYLNENEVEKIRVNLADTYIEINKLDSANSLINRGLRVFKNKDTYRYYQYLILSGSYHLKLKKYQMAIDNLLQCKKYFFTTDDERNKNYTLYYLGESYVGIKQKQKAVQNFAEIDSLIQKSDYIFPELRRVYTYLIDYYKEKKDKEKQLFYIERFLTIDQILDSEFSYVSRELPRRYDKPNLLKEKEAIINELATKKIFFYISLGVLSLILWLFVYLYYKTKKSEKQHRKIAQDLVHSVYESHKVRKETETQNENLSYTEPQENLKDKTTRVIAEEVAKTILKELELFESKEHFLKKGITLATLAKKIKTNSNYLSEIINTHKGKNFNAYLNDLRIDYAISRLAKDKKFSSYKLAIIAEELGYNNEQAFTTAFKKKTGTPLTIYLKEVEKENL
ncbi:hypothetical protein A0O34_21720 [Chryseobacterium glaciei]|uniref:HTH araC/xylS-type domain-containing protein n=1 Tax=Chryseobacterium glaciei TaxID=1685010 RepID=A0A172Y193_9FLAO|nr:helix-turn-helix domain-containing protein [Chryseobacterium glaciei]ANF52981.1 hypothetical protein A0O34_21720 [Chryseobacterium glaciei]